MFTALVEILINSFAINYYHQFADDTELYTVIDPDSSHCLASLAAGADAVTGLRIRNDLLLNPRKTVALVSGTGQQVDKFDTLNGIAVSGSIVPFSSKLRPYLRKMCELVIIIYAPCGIYGLFVDQDTTNTIVC